MQKLKQPNNKKPLIGIIGGNGRLGNWFKIFFEKNGLDVIISGRNTRLTNIDLAKKADIVIVSVPIKDTAAIIKEIKNYVKKDSLLTDLTSIKATPLATMKGAKSGTLGMHPLFGPLISDLQNQTVVFCKQKNNPWVNFLENLLTKNGARVIKMTAQKHDEQMAMIQALLSFNNLAYAGFFAKKKFRPNASMLTPIFKIQSIILGRTLSQSPELYASIEMENPHFQKIAKEYLTYAQNMAKIISQKDYRSFTNNFINSEKFFAGFIEQAQEKSTNILKAIEHQPIKISEQPKVSRLKGSIGFLGPIGTFSWLAAKNISTKQSKLRPMPSIGEVFDMVEKGEIDLGVVPIENSTAGMVFDTIQAFADSSVSVIGSFEIPIHHCLVSKEKVKLDEIKLVKSHPQALAQCKNWLNTNLPNTKREKSASTIAPTQEENPKGTAFILPPGSAEKYNLTTLVTNIEDSKENFTRFFLISRDANNPISKKLKPQNTLLLLSIYDKPGILKDILSVFADKGINLSSLHSIPARAQAWDYMFFVEIEKPLQNVAVKESLKELEKFCSFIKIIGEA